MGRALSQLIAAAIALVLLALLLPTPVQLVEVLTGQRRAATSVADTAMLLVSALGVWLLLLWLSVATLAAVLGRAPGAAGRLARRALRRITPSAARNVLLTVVGAAVLTGVTACGTAEPVSRAGGRIAVEGSAIRPQAGAFESIDIDWPSTRQPAGVAVAGHTPTTPATQPLTPARPPVGIDWPTARAEPGAAVGTDGIVVHRGDSLWSIAARHLPGDADPAQVERLWHQWYLTNRAVIGDDPNLILPGQILLPPNPGTGDRS